MKPLPRLLPTLLFAVCCGHALAGPAPWYQWRSKVDGTLACSQTPLGPGWEKASGPYQDSRCEKKARTR